MKRSPAVLAAVALTVTLAACAEESGETFEVTATDSACTVSEDTAEAGTSTFEVKNSSGAPLAFFVLAPGGGRVYASRDNIAPGETADLTVSLDPGTYATACKLGWRGPDIGPAEFTVTGGADSATDGSVEEQLKDARDNYVTFARRELAELLPQVEDFAEAYAAGDDVRASQLYPDARRKYMGISPLASSVGTLDARINAREDEYKANAAELKKRDQTFTEWLGFHRIEKDIQPDLASTDGAEPTTPRERREIADALIGDVEQLKTTVDKQNFAKSRDIIMDTIAAALRATEQKPHDAHDAEGAVLAARAVVATVEDIAANRGDDGKQLIDDTTSHLDSLQRSAESQIRELESPEASAAAEETGETEETEDTENTASVLDLSQLHEELSRLTDLLGLDVEDADAK